MISRKFPKLRTLTCFKSQRFFSTDHHNEKAAHPAKKLEEPHDSHHEPQSTVEPYKGPINQTQFVKIFPNEENEHFTRSLYNIMGHL